LVIGGVLRRTGMASNASAVGSLDRARRVTISMSSGVGGPLASASSMAARKVSASIWLMRQAVTSAASRRSKASMTTASIS
jgi:hypothetical protein